MNIINLENKRRFFAWVHATYNAGWTCICQQGNVIIKDPGTNGEYNFRVYSPGIWTIIATNNTDTITKTVTISYKGEVVNAYLRYLTLYNAGTSYGITWISGKSSGGEITFDSEYIYLKSPSTPSGGNRACICTSEVNLSLYNKLWIDWQPGSSEYSCFGISSTQNTNYNDTYLVSSWQNDDNTRREQSCDFIDINSGFIKIRICGTNSYSATGYIYKIWLEG